MTDSRAAASGGSAVSPPPGRVASGSAGKTLRLVVVVLAVVGIALTAVLIPPSRSIHGSYIEAYDVRTRRRLGDVSIVEAHSNGVAHWATWVLIIDFAHDMILVQRKRSDGVLCPGAYGVTGEHLEPGETVADASIRGLQEEVGLRADPSNLVSLDNFVFTHTYANGRRDVQNSTVFLYPVANVDTYAVPLRDLPDENEAVDAMAAIPLATFHGWCEAAPDKLCGKAFAKAYLRYLRLACTKAPEGSASMYCAEKFNVRRNRGGQEGNRGTASLLRRQW